MLEHLSALFDNPSIDLLVAPCHPLDAESILDPLPAPGPIQFPDALDGLHHLPRILHEEPRDTGINHLGHAAQGADGALPLPAGAIALLIPLILNFDQIVLLMYGI